MSPEFQVYIENWKLWISGLSGICTFFVAIFAARIAWQQWNTAHIKLNLDLFDRRFAVYEVVRKMFYLGLQEGSVYRDDVRKLSEKIEQADFLFSSDMVSYIKEIAEKTRMVANLKQEQFIKPELATEYKSVKDWFAKEEPLFVDKFKKYMGFDHTLGTQDFMQQFFDGD